MAGVNEKIPYKITFLGLGLHRSSPQACMPPAILLCCSLECCVLPVATHRCLPLDLQKKNSLCPLIQDVVTYCNEDYQLDFRWLHCLMVPVLSLPLYGFRLSNSRCCPKQNRHLLLTCHTIAYNYTTYSLKNSLRATPLVNIKANL